MEFHRIFSLNKHTPNGFFGKHKSKGSKEVETVNVQGQNTTARTTIIRHIPTEEMLEIFCH